MNTEQNLSSFFHGLFCYRQNPTLKGRVVSIVGEKITWECITESEHFQKVEINCRQFLQKFQKIS